MIRLTLSTFVRAALLLTALTLVACGGNAEKPKVLPLLDSARALNSDLRSDWQNTQDMLKSTLGEIEALPQLTVDTKEFDADLLRMALNECFQSPLGTAADASAGAGAVDGKVSTNIETDEDAVKLCQGESLNALLDLSKRYDDEIAKFIKVKIRSVATLKVNLKNHLPTQATNIAEDYARARDQVEKWNVTVADLKKQADAHEDMTADEKRQFRSDYEAMQKELQSLDALLDGIEADSLNLNNQIRSGIERVNQGLTTFGQ